MNSRRTLFLLLLTALSLFSLHAQVQRGYWLLDGGFLAGYTRFSYDPDFLFADEKAFTTGFSPAALFFATDRLAVGGSVGLAFLFREGGDDGAYTLAPQVRYYLSNPRQRLLWFGDAGLAWNRRFLNGGNSSTLIHLGGGMDYFLNPNAALEGTLLFRHIAYGSADLDALSQLELLFRLRSFAGGAPQAPLRRGNWLVSDQILGIAVGLNSDERNLAIQLQPRAGLFVSDALALGAGIELIGNRLGPDNGDAWAFRLTPFARYYLPAGSRSAWFLAAEGSLGRSTADIGDFKERQTDWWLQAGGGFNYFLSNFLALEATLNYRFRRIDADIDVPNFDNTQTRLQQVNIELGLQLFLAGRTGGD